MEEDTLIVKKGNNYAFRDKENALVMPEEMMEDLKKQMNYEEAIMCFTNSLIDIRHKEEEIEKLNKELDVYKLRHKLALRKLNSAIGHYDTERENNAIIFTKEILEGKGIEEKCHKILRGDNNG